jgi:hypothetical protein
MLFPEQMLYADNLSAVENPSKTIESGSHKNPFEDCSDLV